MGHVCVARIKLYFNVIRRRNFQRRLAPVKVNIFQSGMCRLHDVHHIRIRLILLINQADVVALAVRTPGNRLIVVRIPA